MIYTRRRAKRLRMTQLAALKHKIEDVVVLVKDFIPELMAAVGVAFVMFYLLPTFFTVIAAIGR